MNFVLVVLLLRELLPSLQPDLGLRGGDVELHVLKQVSVKRESAAADSSLGPRVKEQKVHLEQFVKDWFIDFADLQKSKHSWTRLCSFQESPALFAGCLRFGRPRVNAVLEALTGSGRETNVWAPDHALCCSLDIAL